MKVRIIAVIIMALSGLTQTVAQTPPSAEKTILLVDDHDILYRSGTVRFLNVPEKSSQNPVIKEEKPWELALAFNSVYRNPKSGKYQMWYQSFGGYNIPDKKLQCVVCYAESDDGITFTKPELGIFDYNGVKNTNIVLIGAGGYGDRYGNSVCVDERETDLNKRYKMLYYDFIKNSDGVEFPGLCAAFSPDGIHWTKYDKNPLDRQGFGAKGQTVPFMDESVFSQTPKGDRMNKMWRIPLGMSDAADVFYDSRLGEFVAYGKSWIDGPEGKMCWKHAMARSRSKDFVNWSKAELVFTTDDFDPDYLECHTSPVFYYNGIYFCLNEMLNRELNGGVMYIELMTSRDGVKWERNFRKDPFIKNGSEGEFDAGSIFTNSTPIVLDKEIRFYYGGYDKGAIGGGAWITGPKQVSGVGYASIGIDRFAGIQPIEKTVINSKKILYNIGQITLKPIATTNYKKMSINADVEGSIKVEILNEDGYKLRGYSADDSIPIKGDSVEHGVKWKEKSLADLAKGNYIIRLHLDNAKVFALTLK